MVTELIPWAPDSSVITPDVMRLLIIFAFAYGAVLDYRTRRVYNEFWIPLIGLCFIVLGWDIALLMVESAPVQQGYLLSLGISILVAPSIAYTLWEMDLFGGADLKALAFLAVFFPQVPEITVNGFTYPLVEGMTPIFTLTVLVNALIIAFGYRVFLMGRNLVNFDVQGIMTRATRYDVHSLQNRHGDIIEGRNGIRSRGVDIDTIRMYLQWRGISFEELRENADFYRSTDPVVENEIGDGSVPDASDTPLGHSRAEFRPPTVNSGPSLVPLGAVTNNPDDKWSAEKFAAVLDEKQAVPSVTTAEIRESLDVLVEKNRVWVSPAIPFFIPLTLGLIVAVTYGSIFVGVTEWVSNMIVQLVFG